MRRRCAAAPLSELLLDADGGWARLIAQARGSGVVAGAQLAVGSPDGQPQTVQVTAALMNEGEQSCLGFILRPGRAAEGADPRLGGQPAEDPVLAGLLDQVGRVPLADLLVEVAHRAERQLITNALLRTGGRCDAAAAALGLSTEALALRLQRHGLAGLDAAGPGASPPLIN